MIDDNGLTAFLFHRVDLFRGQPIYRIKTKKSCILHVDSGITKSVYHTVKQ